MKPRTTPITALVSVLILTIKTIGLDAAVKLKWSNSLSFNSTAYRWTSQSVDYERDHLYFIEYFAHSHYELTMIHGPTWTIFKMNLTLNQESAFDLSEYVCRIAWDPTTKRLAVAGVKLISTLDLIVGYINVTSGKVDITGNLVKSTDMRSFFDFFSIGYQSQFLIQLGALTNQDFSSYRQFPTTDFYLQGWTTYAVNASGGIQWFYPKQLTFRRLETDWERGLQYVFTTTAIDVLDAVTGTQLQRITFPVRLPTMFNPSIGSFWRQNRTLHVLWDSTNGVYIQSLYFTRSDPSFRPPPSTSPSLTFLPLYNLTGLKWVERAEWIGQLMGGWEEGASLLVHWQSSLKNSITRTRIDELQLGPTWLNPTAGTSSGGSVNPGSLVMRNTLVPEFNVTTDGFDRWAVTTRGFLFVFCVLSRPIMAWETGTLLSGMQLMMFEMGQEGSGATPITEQPLPTNPSTKDTNNVTNQSVNLLLIVISCVLFFILLLVLLFSYRYVHKIRRSQFAGKTETTFSEFSRFTHRSVSTTMSGMTTKNFTQYVLAIPGYLEISSTGDVQMVRRLASGGMGDIYLATAVSAKLRERLPDQSFVIIKVPKNPSPAALPAFLQELSLMAYLSGKYPYFSEFYAYQRESQMMILKYYELGSLYDWVRTIAPWTSSHISHLMTDIAKGIEAMHRENMAHCDLKPENILIEGLPSATPSGHWFKAVLSDLGTSRILTEDLPVKKFETVQHRGLSIFYAAPEVFQVFRRGGSERKETRSPAVIQAADLYALSCVLHFCLHCDTPWIQTEI